MERRLRIVAGPCAPMIGFGIGADSRSHGGLRIEARPVDENELLDFRIAFPACAVARPECGDLRLAGIDQPQRETAVECGVIQGGEGFQGIRRAKDRCRGEEILGVGIAGGFRSNLAGRRFSLAVPPGRRGISRKTSRRKACQESSGTQPGKYDISGCYLHLLSGICFSRGAPETAVGPDRRAGKRGAADGCGLKSPAQRLPLAIWVSVRDNSSRSA